MVSINLRMRSISFAAFPMRLQRSGLLEIAPVQRLFNLGEVESQLPVKQDLLEHQKLRLFVESLAIRPVKCRLQQADFIVKMECPHADSRHGSHLFDGVGHSSPKSC
jgi:hypothetical protein